MEYRSLRIDQLNFTATPVRRNRTDQAMERLKNSIAATAGPIDPLLVRELGGREYIVVAGESRLRALIELGYPPDSPVPCLVGTFDDRQATEYALIENCVRSPLTPYEEALALRVLHRDWGMKQKRLAELLGRSRQQIGHLLEIFELLPEVRAALHLEEITLGHARVLYLLRNSARLQKRLLEEIRSRGLSVRAASTRARELNGEGARWLIDPGDVWVSKAARLSIHPGASGYRVNFTFENGEELEQLLMVLRNRLREGPKPE